MRAAAAGATAAMRVLFQAGADKEAKDNVRAACYSLVQRRQAFGMRVYVYFISAVGIGVEPRLWCFARPQPVMIMKCLIGAEYLRRSVGQR